MALLLGAVLLISCAEREGPIEPKDAFKFVASIATEGQVYDVVVEDGWAYLATGELGLTTIDVRDPRQPRFGGRLDPPNGYSKSLVVVHRGARKFACVTAGSYLGMYVADVTTPAAPFYWAEVPPTYVESYEDVAAVDTMLYVADRSGGLASFDIRELDHTPPDVHFANRLRLPGYARGVAVRDGVIYIAQGEAGLVTARHRPENFSGVMEPLDSLDTEDYANDVAVGTFGDQTVAFVADNARGIWVIDATNPADLRQIGWHRTPGNAKQVILHRDRLLVADSYEGVLVLDVSRPDRPHVIGQYIVNASYGVAADDDYIYVGTTRNGLVILSW